MKFHCHCLGKGKGEDLMFRKFTWLACATLLCALLIALPADQVALAADVGTADAFIKAVKEGGTVTASMGTKAALRPSDSNSCKRG